MKRTIRVAPSILAADFSRLGEEIRRVEAAGADMIHVDVMDGHFVPNLALGIPVVEAMRKTTTLHFDTHLMMDNPLNFLEAFARAGAGCLTVHLEVFPDPGEILDRIGGLGMKRGLALNPDTPVEKLRGNLGKVDRLIVMGVFPGFGGQTFLPETIGRIAAARRLLDEEGRGEAEVEVDGGIGPDNAAAVAAAGAGILVAGTAVFRAPDPAAAIRKMKGL